MPTALPLTLPLTVLWFQLSTSFRGDEAGHKVVAHGSGCRHRCGAPGTGPRQGRGSHHRFWSGITACFHAIQVDLSHASGLALILHSLEGRETSGHTPHPCPLAVMPLGLLSHLTVPTTHHLGSCLLVSTSSAGRPGTGFDGPYPRGTFLLRPGTCRGHKLLGGQCHALTLGLELGQFCPGLIFRFP